MSNGQTLQTEAVPHRWRYGAVAEYCNSPELGRYHTYAIQVIDRRANELKILDIIHDITLSRRAAESLAALFNRRQLSPIHFKDVVADMLP